MDDFILPAAGGASAATVLSEASVRARGKFKFYHGHAKKVKDSIKEKGILTMKETFDNWQ